jgi:hypothetical protein
LTEGSYRRRLAERREREVLQRRSATGVVLGCVVAFEGFYRLLFKTGVHDALWTTAAIAGVVILALTLVAPVTIAPAEKALRFAGQSLFKALLSALLVVIYFVFFVPLGRALRKRYPLTSWSDAAPDLGVTGWEEKRLQRTAAREGEQRRPLLLLPLLLLSYLARERQFVLMPVVLLLVILGLVLLFVQTSAIAPFIYTLF